jgi:hypothetical protein
MAYSTTYTVTYPASTATGSFTIDVGFPVLPKPKGPWKFLYGPPQPVGGVTAEVVQAKNKTLTLRTEPGQNHQASFDVNGRSAAAADIVELETDVYVMFGDNILFDGRVGDSQDTLDADEHRTVINAYDYREVLRRRAVLPGDTVSWPTSTARSDIAWQMIKATQGRDGGNLGITRGLIEDTSNTLPSYTATLGDYIGDDIDTLAQLSPAFEWEINPYGMADLRLDIFSPRKGQDNDVVLTYGDNRIAQITRKVDPSTFADAVYVTGTTLSGSTTVESGSNGGTISNIATWSNPSPGVLEVADSSGFITPGLIKVHCSGKTNAIVSFTGTSAGGRFTGCKYVSGSPSGTVGTGATVDVVPLVAQQLENDAIGTRPEQRWDATIGTQDQTQDTLNADAAGLLQSMQVVVPAYEVILHPGAWDGPDWLFLGDTVTLRIDSGRLQVNEKLRVVEMAFAISADNVETLTLTIGAIPFKIHKKIATIFKRLRYLETR